MPDASPPKPSRVQEMQYSSSEIALATGTSTESFRRKAYADGPSLPRAHKKFLTDAGLDTQASMVDDVVFGRNLDGASGVNDVRRSGAFRGASGRTSNEIHAFDNKSAAKRLVEAPWAASGRSSRRATSLGRSTTLPAAPAASTTDRMTASDYQIA